MFSTARAIWVATSWRNAGAPSNERGDHVGPHAISQGALFHLVLTFLLEVTPEQGALVLEDRSHVALPGAHFEAHHEVVEERDDSRTKSRSTFRAGSWRKI